MSFDCASLLSRVIALGLISGFKLQTLYHFLPKPHQTLFRGLRKAIHFKAQLKV